jgi:hypothetical protein
MIAGARVASRALPYPPLEQMGCSPTSLSVFKGSISRFRFPGGLWTGKGKRPVIARLD